MLGYPFDLLCGLQDLVLPDLDEPLFFRENLDGRVTPPALADVLFRRLGVDEIPLVVKIRRDRLFCLVDCQQNVR